MCTPSKGVARNRLPCLATQWLHPVRTAIGLHPIINRLLKVISHTHLHTLNLYTPLHTHLPPQGTHPSTHTPLHRVHTPPHTPTSTGYTPLHRPPHTHPSTGYIPLHTYIPQNLRHTTPSHFTYSLTKPPMHANTPYLSQFKIDTETERDVHEWFKYHQEFIKQSAKFFVFRNEHQKCCWPEVPAQCVYKGDEARGNAGQLTHLVLGHCGAASCELHMM